MDNISWFDLYPGEQRAIALLGAGMPIELCDNAALVTIRRAGLVGAPVLTPKAEKLRRSAVLDSLAASSISVEGQNPEILRTSRGFPLCTQLQTLLDAVGTSHLCHRQTLVLYAMRVSRKKSASGLTNEFIATCSEFTCSPCRLTYSYAACSRSRSG